MPFMSIDSIILTHVLAMNPCDLSICSQHNLEEALEKLFDELVKLGLHEFEIIRRDSDDMKKRR